MTEAANDKCYSSTATAHKWGRISSLEFFQRILHHFGPTATRVHHPEDDSPPKIPDYMIYNGLFGHVALSIKLCKSDPLAESVNPDQLIEMFMACTKPDTTVDAIQSMDLASDTPVLGSALFRRALVVAAIQSKNLGLAASLIEHNPPVSPPPEQSLFDESLLPSVLEDDRSVSAGVCAALVEADWMPPSRNTASIAACSYDGEAGIALFKAMRHAGCISWLNHPMDKKILPELALRLSTPSLLHYIHDAYVIREPPTPDMLVKAIESRKSGGIEMLTWLLEQGVDVNYISPGSPLVGTSRDLAEEQMMLMAGPGTNVKTALHAAAYMGNMEAVRFLLQKGADPLLKDGIGQTAETVARRGRHLLVAEVLRSKRDAEA